MLTRLWHARGHRRYLDEVVGYGLAAFGFAFQLPVVIFFLARIGLLDHKDMIRGFRYAMVGIFVLAAAIPPPAPTTWTVATRTRTGAS